MHVHFSSLLILHTIIFLRLNASSNLRSNLGTHRDWFLQLRLVHISTHIPIQAHAALRITFLKENRRKHYGNLKLIIVDADDKQEKEVSIIIRDTAASSKRKRPYNLMANHLDTTHPSMYPSLPDLS